MASTYSTNLAIELIGTGDQAGSWGNTTNTNLGTLIEQAISGYVTQAVSTGTDTTITIPNGATGVARNMYIELTGTGGTNTNLIVPSNKKLYFIFNNTSSGQVTVKVSGQTGVSVPQGKKVVLVSNGTDVVNGLNYIADFGTNSFTVTNLTATSATITTLTGTSAGITTISSGSANITQLQSTSATITTLTGTSANITTLSGTTATFTSATVTNLVLTSVTLSNLNIASANITTLTSSSATISTTLALSAGTANGVLYLNASKVATSGSALTFNGTLFTNRPTSDANTNIARFGVINSAGTDDAFLNISADAANNLITLDSTGNNTGAFAFSTGGGEKMRLTAAGDLGIGTSSPQRKIHGYIATGPVARFQTSGSNAATEYVPGATDGTGAIYNWVIGAQYNVGNTFEITPSTAAGGLTFSTPAFVVNSSGNVGIGTSSPGSLYSGANNLVVGGGSGNTGMTVYSGTTGVGRLFFADGTVGADAYRGWLEYGHTGNDLTIGTNGATRLTIDASGNFGLGVTPSAWSGGKAIQVKNSSNPIFISESGGDGWFGYNAYYNSPNWVYAGSYYANALKMADGQFQFMRAASGTAGNTITWTQAMTLDASGRLLIGGTSTYDFNGQANLVVNGTSNNATITLASTGVGYIAFADGTSGTDRYAGRIDYDHGSNFMAFNTSAAERARITSGGYFKASDSGSYIDPGIFHEFTQTANSEALQVRATNGSYANTAFQVRASRNTTNNSYYYISCYNDGAANYRLRVADSGDVTNVNGTYGTISDAKMKADIVDAGSQWDDIKAVRFRKFKMKDDPSGLMQLGVVAQELEQTSPGLVDEHTDRDAEGNDLGTTTKSVKTSVLLMKAAVALQEAMARIEKLEAEMAALKGA